MLQARWFRNHHSWWKNLVWGHQDTTLESPCLSNHSLQVDQYHILQFLSFNWPVHLQGKTAYKLRVCTCLENPWISGVQFQGLESAWIWFSVLASPSFFYWMRLKNINAWLLRKWKPVKTKFSGKQSIMFSKCSQNVRKGMFFIPSALFLLLSYVCWATNAQYMSGFHMLSSSCFLEFLYVFWGLGGYHNARQVSF